MKRFRKGIFVLLLLGVVAVAYAATGTIDPRNVGNWKAQVQNSGLGANTTINFGKFTTQSAYNITVSDSELRGFAWGNGVGWIVTNCADTTSGCSVSNDNFKIANDGTGNLSGYAWGENTGWINFGPFTNPAISTVKITNGFFGGTLGDAGYAWSQNYGWILFDCTQVDSCVETDWGVTTTASCSDGIQNQNETGVDTGGVCGGGGTTGGYPPSCSDGIKNQNETGVDSGGVCSAPPVIPSCSDGIQNQNETGVDIGGICGTTNPPVNPPTNPPINPPVTPPVNPPSNPPSINPPSGPSGCQLNSGLCVPTIPPSTPSSGGKNPLIDIVTATGVIMPIASAIVSFVVSNPITFKDIPLLFGQGWSSFLTAIGMKKRRKPWGVVYDSITKRPIDPAYVMLTDMMGNEIATAITDINGRYGFAVDPGTYKIVVNKSNYVFPSTKLAGKTSDSLYDDLYFGGDVVVAKEGEIITKNIPIDQIAFDWNEYTKAQGGTYGQKLHMYRLGDVILYHLARFLFVLGFAFAIYAQLFYPSLYNMIVLGLYAVLTILQLFTPAFNQKGSVKDKYAETPLPFSVVRLVSTVTGREVARKVADRVGSYYGLVPNGNYKIVIDKKRGAEEYEKHELDKDRKVTEGYIKEKFKI